MARIRIGDFAFCLTDGMLGAVYKETALGNLTPTYDVRVGYSFYNSFRGRNPMARRHPEATQTLQVLYAVPGKQGAVHITIYCTDRPSKKISTTQSGLLRILQFGAGI